jgi:hypothetical protein
MKILVQSNLISKKYWKLLIMIIVRKENAVEYSGLDRKHI